MRDAEMIGIETHQALPERRRCLQGELKPLHRLIGERFPAGPPEIPLIGLRSIRSHRLGLPSSAAVHDRLSLSRQGFPTRRHDRSGGSIFGRQLPLQPSPRIIAHGCEIRRADTQTEVVGCPILLYGFHDLFPAPTLYQRAGVESVDRPQSDAARLPLL